MASELEKTLKEELEAFEPDLSVFQISSKHMKNRDSYHGSITVEFQTIMCEMEERDLIAQASSI